MAQALLCGDPPRFAAFAGECWLVVEAETIRPNEAARVRLMSIDRAS
jgi:hypothetical protein